MDERRLILNDGTEIEGGYAGISSRGNLWLWFTGYTMAQAVMMFLDTEKTEKIVFMASETEEVYEGYTEMKSINVDANGQFHVGMAKGE